MNRYPFILLIALVLCAPCLMANDRPQWAQDSGYTYIENYVTKGENDTLETVVGQYQTMLKEAVQGYATKAQDFGTTYITPYNSTEGTNLVNTVNGYAQAYTGSTAEEFNMTSMNSNVTQFFNMATQESQNGDLAKNLQTATTNTKETYGKDLKDIVGFFMDDVKNQTFVGQNGAFNVDDYRKDFNLLRDYVRDSNAVTSETVTKTRHNFDPYDFLDRGMPRESRDRVEVNVLYDGTENQYSGYTVKELIAYVTGKFSGDQVLQSDVNWFNKVWNSESDVTDPNTGYHKVIEAYNKFDHLKNDEAGVNLTQYQTITNNGKESIIGSDSYNNGVRDAGDGKTIQVNEYGTLTSEGVRDDQSLTTVRVRDVRYNNRSFGFRDGNFDTVSITVGNRRYQLYDQFYTSPLVFDLDGDGKLEASKGEWLPHKYDNTKLVEFDIDGDQFIELTEWVGSNDGLLLVGYEKGKEINANHMFGEAGGYKNGYEKLSLFDTNGDKQISGDELKTLSIWQDKDGNGKVDDGEVVAVTELGITSIALTNDQLVGSFVQKGETRKVWDWYPTYFRIKPQKP